MRRLRFADNIIKYLPAAPDSRDGQVEYGVTRAGIFLSQVVLPALRVL